MLNRRTFFAAVAGALAFPSMAKPDPLDKWKKEMLKPVAGYHQRNFLGNQYQTALGVNDFWLKNYEGVKAKHARALNCDMERSLWFGNPGIDIKRVTTRHGVVSYINHGVFK